MNGAEAYMEAVGHSGVHSLVAHGCPGVLIETARPRMGAPILAEAA